MSVADTERESALTGCTDGLCFQQDPKDHAKISSYFPGSWSDVSSGALFEMDVETKLASHSTSHARKNFSDTSGEGKLPFPQSKHELDFGKLANTADDDEPPLEDFRYFTQRRTSTSSIPIPKRKPHMTYRMHPTV
jgi:hypothetical protein